ncbi:DUF218 domain-containing protein [Parafrankia irregularis]|uniref:DUF218 domain-containing protein n=1 Tax=Parafrankia irregularis TaxID=795642 RepID=A0A0S4QLF6_9ACTN|nr:MULTISPECIES: YdcF family protein [Parafrankia]CUU56417.1 DUF218 domain-containing protein [Parafrankia irregularis]
MNAARTRLGGACLLVVGVLGWGELEHWRASRRQLGTTTPDHPGLGCVTGAGEVVVVLGFRNRSERINAVNRWRVRAGLRSLEGAKSRLVLAGGPVGGPRAEADLMADYARDTRGYHGPLSVETTSRSTWENISNIIPLLEDADRIKIVSDSLHAERARGYLWRQRPDLAARLVRGGDHRFGEYSLLKPALALLGRRRLRRRKFRAVSPGSPSAARSTASAR